MRKEGREAERWESFRIRAWSEGKILGVVIAGVAFSLKRTPEGVGFDWGGAAAPIVALVASCDAIFAFWRIATTRETSQQCEVTLGGEWSGDGIDATPAWELCTHQLSYAPSSALDYTNRFSRQGIRYFFLIASRAPGSRVIRSR